jgi:hypothetical protein
VVVPERWIDSYAAMLVFIRVVTKRRLLSEAATKVSGLIVVVPQRVARIGRYTIDAR